MCCDIHTSEPKPQLIIVDNLEAYFSEDAHRAGMMLALLKDSTSCCSAMFLAGGSLPTPNMSLLKAQCPLLLSLNREGAAVKLITLHDSKTYGNTEINATLEGKHPSLYFRSIRFEPSKQQ